MKKGAVVYTNDINRPKQNLFISGSVDIFATIRPQHLSLRGYAGETIKGKVTIVPEKKYPFKILDTRAKNGKHFSFKLDEVKKSGSQAYELKIENLTRETGRYHDTIILKTDSQVRPELNVRVYGYLRARKTE